MIAFILDNNVIIAEAFLNKIKHHLTAIYLKIKKQLNKRGFNILLHILDNEAPEMYRDAIES